MNEEISSLGNLSEEALDALLKRSVRNTAILGLIPALVLLIASGWRNAAMLMTGALISAASLLEWQRLARLMSARMKRKQAPRGAVLAIGFFLLRLLIFAAVIYGSLKCFQGSLIALMCGLSLAVVTLMWEALRMLRG
ncbi:MAG: ATP synthase subunit I [Terracidiphilus sp.]